MEEFLLDTLMTCRNRVAPKIISHARKLVTNTIPRWFTKAMSVNIAIKGLIVLICFSMTASRSNSQL